MGIQINGQTDTVTATDGSINVGGDVTIPGVLTYEDVTNVDSVGVVTARNDINIENATPTLNLIDTDGSTTASFLGNSGNIFYSTSSSNRDHIFRGSTTEVVRITGDGNIGIGTDNPPANLSVDGSIIFGNTTSSGSGGTLRIVESGNSVYIQPGSNTSNDSSCDLIISSINGVSERLRITSGGDMGLGTASPRSITNFGSFAINGTAGAFTDYFLNGTRTGTTAVDSNGFTSEAVGSSTPFRVITNGSERLRIDSNGRVSINDNSRPASDANEGAQLRVTGTPLTRNQYYSPAGDYFGSFGYTDNTYTKSWIAVDSSYNKTSSVSSGIFLSAFHADAGGSACGHTIKNVRTDAGGLIFSSVATGSVNNPAVETERLRITSGGNVIIKSGSDQGNIIQMTGADTTSEILEAGIVSGYVQLTASYAAGGNNTCGFTFRTRGGAGGTNEKVRITPAGQMGLGTNDPNSYGGNVKLAVANTSGTCGLSIVSATNGDGNLYYADGTSGDATYRGYIRYNHTLDQFRIGIAGAERLRITPTTAGVSSTGSGANGVGCVGIDDNSPNSRALALSIGGGSGLYGIEDSRPLVYLQRSYGIGGGSSTDETTLEVNAPGSYNSAGVIYGIKSFARHNLNGSHYAGHFENHGSQYSANGTSALYAKTTKLDTNGPGDVIAFRADASVLQVGSSSGSAIAGYFATGNNANTKPLIVQNGYTTNSYSNQIIFRKHNGSSIVDVGSIKSNNTATQYNTSSDYRLKENIVSLTGAIDRLKQLQPKRFNFIGIDETIDGFIAHEVNPVAPYAVSGEKDAVKKELVLDEDGKEQFGENGEIIHREVIDPQGVDYSKLTTLTIAALQEALAKIETLEAKVAVLEGS